MCSVAVTLPTCAIHELVLEFSRVPGVPYKKNFLLLVATRVTRLDEFSPIGQLFRCGSFRKIAKIAQIFRLLFAMVQYMFQLWQKLHTWAINRYFGRLFRKLIGSPWLWQLCFKWLILNALMTFMHLLHTCMHVCSWNKIKIPQIGLRPKMLT
jgi:hypothetical protein